MTRINILINKQEWLLVKMIRIKCGIRIQIGNNIAYESILDL